MTTMILKSKLSKFMEYLAQSASEGREFLPSLNELSDQLGMSISTLREELQVAKAMGLVEVKPRTGIRCLPYKFSPAVSLNLAYAVSIDHSRFREFSDLRSHTEASYWYQAVSNLTLEDVAELKEIIKKAQGKLSADPVQIPHLEHRQLHLTIYRRLNNAFVEGILESYWDIYESIGLNVYEDRVYLERVWNYHHQMVEAIAKSDFLSGYQALIAHMDLLFQREQNNAKIPFE
jgi:DNA-binding FadR family transcriptional regulator